MSPKISESILRIRKLSGDLKTSPEGDPSPDIKYTDLDIFQEIISALREALKKSPSVFYPDYLGARSRIRDLVALGTAGQGETEEVVEARINAGVLPIHDSALPEVEARAFQSLEATAQEGVRPEVSDEFVQALEQRLSK